MYRQKSIILKDFVNIGQVRMSLLNLLEVEVWVFFFFWFVLHGGILALQLGIEPRPQQWNSES